MTAMTKTRAAARIDADITSIAFAALLGLALVFVTGFAGASVVHDTTHDVRHAVGFPCH